MVSVFNSKAIMQLKAAGVIPQDCISFQMIADVNDVIRLRYEVLADEATVQSIADAILNNPGEFRREVTVSDRGNFSHETKVG